MCAHRDSLPPALSPFIVNRFLSYTCEPEDTAGEGSACAHVPSRRSLSYFPAYSGSALGMLLARFVRSMPYEIWWDVV